MVKAQQLLKTNLNIQEHTSLEWNDWPVPSLQFLVQMNFCTKITFISL